MKKLTINFNIDNLLACANLLSTDIITLCVILVILGALTLFALQGFSGSLRTELRHGDPFVRSQFSSINLLGHRLNNDHGLTQLGYTPDPGPRRYAFVFDDKDPTFVNARRAGIFIPDGRIVTLYGCQGYVVQLENLSGNPVRIANLHFDFNVTALHAYGAHRVHVHWANPNFAYDFHGRNARATFTDYESRNGDHDN